MLLPASVDTQPDPHALHDALNEVLGMAARLFTTRLVAVSRVEGTTCTVMALLDHQRALRPGMVLSLHETLCARTLEQNVPYHVDDLHTALSDDQIANNALGIPIGAYLGVPLRLANGRVWGSLWTVDTEPRQFTPANVRMLSMLAQLLGHELERTNTQRQQQRVAEMGEAHNSVDPLTGLLSRQGFFDALTQAAQPEAGTYAVAIVCLQPQTVDHATANVVRQGLADTLMRTTRLIDSCGRIDHDMFAIVMPGTTRADAQPWHARVQDEVATWNMIHNSVGLDFRVAVGIADSSEASSAAAIVPLALERVHEPMG